ncbi:Protein of unknown function [Gryllus bimaculatus]|nr:Protein of unknown function [Gryllus bimaculatus]
MYIFLETASNGKRGMRRLAGFRVRQLTRGSACVAGMASVPGSAGGAAAGAAAGAGTTVRIGLAERERLLAALRECARAVEAVGREAAPAGRPLSPAVAHERSALLASLAHAVGLVETAPVVLAAASPRGEDVSAALQGVGGGLGGCRPKERGGVGGGDLRRSKTPAPTSAGAAAATARTKSTGDVVRSAGAGPGAQQLRAGGGRDAPSPSEAQSPAAIKGSYLESGTSGAGTEDSGEDSTDKDDKEDGDSDRTDDAASGRKSTDRGGGETDTDSDSSDQALRSDLTRSLGSSDSGTLTRSSSASSTSFAENWTSENTSSSRPAPGSSKGREVKKSVSFYLGAGEKRGTDSAASRKGGNENALKKKKAGRPNLMSLVTKLSREEQRLSKTSRDKGSTSLSALIQEMSADHGQKLKSGMTRKLANAEREKKPGSRGSRGRRERPMDAIIARKKKVGHENLSLELKKIKANVSITTEKSNANIAKQDEQTRIYMRRSVSNLQQSNNSTKKSEKSSKPKSVNLQKSNRTLEINKGGKHGSYEMKRVSSALGNTGARTNKTSEANHTPRI